MKVLSVSELLTVWERGLTQSWIERGLSLLEAACPEESNDVLAQMSIGQRDCRLLTLRERTLGTHITIKASCASCGEQVELNFETADIRLRPEIEVPTSEILEKDGYQVEFRLPNSRDLATATAKQEVQGFADQLLQRCILSVRHGGEPLEEGKLPAAVTQAVLDEMERADPQANVQLAIACPACGYEWQAIFDILTFFWAELDAWAPRLLMEVHTIASAYGWHEADILAMTARRRQFYLEAIAG